MIKVSRFAAGSTVLSVSICEYWNMMLVPPTVKILSPEFTREISRHLFFFAGMCRGGCGDSKVLLSQETGHCWQLQDVSCGGGKLSKSKMDVFQWQTGALFWSQDNVLLAPVLYQGLGCCSIFQSHVNCSSWLEVDPKSFVDHREFLMPLVHIL